MKQTWMAVLGLGLGCLGVLQAADNPAAEKIVLVPPTVLAFDADLKQHTPKSTNEKSATFTFWVTNVCLTNVILLEVSSSCGCTVSKFPSQPWLLQPWESGSFKVTMDLHDYSGTVFKGVLVHSSAGVKALVLRVNLPDKKIPIPGFSTHVPAPAPAPKSEPLRPSLDRKPGHPPGT